MSRLNLQRLNLVRDELEAAIEREVKQVERLAFALQKVEGDEAYHRSVERQLEKERARARQQQQQQ